MINNSEDFSRIYTDLLSSHNYRGLVGLLSSTTFNDDNTRNAANKLIEQFQEQADIEDKLLENADPATVKAYHFITNGPSKNDISVDENDPNYNSPSSRFMRGWNSLANENNIINIKFNNEEEYNTFINNLGGDEAKVRERGINLDSNYSVSFPTDIDNKIGIYNAIKASGVYSNVNKNKVNNQYLYQGLDYTGTPVSSDAGKIIIDSHGNMYAPNESGAILNETTDKIIRFNEMNDAVDEATEAYAKLFENNDVKPYLNEMIVTGYMGEDDRKLQDYFSKGFIDLQSFKEMRSILEEKYTRTLQTKSLSQYEVWAMNEDNDGSEVLEPLDDALMKNQLDIEINDAIKDGRIHYAHATNGIDIGTMIVIDQKKDDKGNVVGDSQPRRFFVKDLFRSQAENALRDDTQTAAQMQYSKHQTYGHIYRGVNGSTITDWNQNSDTAVYTNSNGTSERKNKAELLDIIDNDVIAKRMIDYYNSANKADNNGNGYTQEFYKVYGANGFNSKTLYDNISARAFAAMSAKYKEQSQDFINYKTQELVSAILKGIGVNFEEELDSSTGEQNLDIILRNRNINIQ